MPTYFHICRSERLYVRAKKLSGERKMYVPTWLVGRAARCLLRVGCSCGLFLHRSRHKRLWAERQGHAIKQRQRRPCEPGKRRQRTNFWLDQFWPQRCLAQRRQLRRGRLRHGWLPGRCRPRSFHAWRRWSCSLLGACYPGWHRARWHANNGAQRLSPHYAIVSKARSR